MSLYHLIVRTPNRCPQGADLRREMCEYQATTLASLLCALRLSDCRPVVSPQIRLNGNINQLMTITVDLIESKADRSSKQVLFVICYTLFDMIQQRQKVSYR
jgi:hypothetical protein